MNAKNAGLSLEIVFTPCRYRKVDAEMKWVMKQLANITIDKFWAYPDDSGLCRWSDFEPDQNCQYLQQMIDYTKKTYGITMGVAASKQDWQDNFGDVGACP